MGMGGASTKGIQRSDKKWCLLNHKESDQFCQIIRLRSGTCHSLIQRCNSCGHLFTYSLQSARRRGQCGRLALTHTHACAHAHTHTHTHTHTHARTMSRKTKGKPSMHGYLSVDMHLRPISVSKYKTVKSLTFSWTLFLHL